MSHYTAAQLLNRVGGRLSEKIVQPDVELEFTIEEGDLVARGTLHGSTVLVTRPQMSLVELLAAVAEIVNADLATLQLEQAHAEPEPAVPITQLAAKAQPEQAGSAQDETVSGPDDF